MLKVNLILLSFLMDSISSTVAVAFVCPERPILAHYPNPQNCNSYIYCVRGTPYPVSCPGNLYWNPSIKRCDESRNVDCKVVSPPPKPIPTQTVTAPLVPVTTKPNTQLTERPNPILHSNSSIELQMPSTNKPLISTSSPENTCPVITINPLPGKFRHTFSCENQPCGIYPNINDCSSFLLCSNGVEILKHCNDGQLFDTRSQECQPSKTAHCWEEPVEPLEETPEVTRNLCSFHNKSSFANSGLPEEIILKSPVLTNWGNWEGWKFCPLNSYVNGIYVWRQLVQRGSIVDQAGVVSLSLNCANVNGDRVSNIVSIAPGAPDEGWPEHFTCSGTGIGFQMNSQHDLGSQDDLATDNVELICSCGPSVHKRYEDQTGLQSGNRGVWTGENICLPKQAICGMQTQMHTFSRDGTYDNTGLNNFNVKCCNIPSPSKSCKPVEAMKLIRKCSNLNGNFHRRCDFRSNIGLSYEESSNINAINFYESVGYTLNDTSQELKVLFKDNLGKSNKSKTSTHYDWEVSPENIWYKASSSVKFVYINVNTTAELYQVVGKCSMYEVRTNLIVKIDMNARGESETTYYEI